jgi:parvulin-like peptidyl-prolyl isomerase
MKKVLFFAVFAAVFGLAACKEDKGAVIAKVGGTEITEKMLAEKVQNMLPEYQNFVNTPLGKKQFIDAIVRENIMIEAAKQAGVDKKPEYTQAIADFKREQERQSGEFRDGLLIETYIKEIHTGMIASEADMEQYYNDNKELFDAPVEYTVRHILLTNKVEAEIAFARLEKGEKFENVAKEISQDTGSAANGGLIGPVKRGDLVPEFEKAALALKNNEMSGIIETSYGYHIIFKVSEKKLPPVPFEQVKPEIKGTIEKERFEKWLEAARQRLGVTVDQSKAEAANFTPAAQIPPQNDAVVAEQEN